MDLTPGMKALSPWWGTIQSAVYQRASTADLWAAVREAAAAEGFVITGATAADMSALRGIAAEQRSALEAFSAGNPAYGIEGTMIARDISSRSISEQQLAPSFIARFQWTSLVDGVETTEWRSSVWQGFLPPTKGDILDQLNQDAEIMAEDYGAQHVGIGDVLITAV